MSLKRLHQFDTIARYYDRLATLVYGRNIKIAQTRYLHHIPENSNVLVLGGGTGWWLGALLNERMCTVWYIEASGTMIKYALQNSNHSSRVKFIHGTYEDIPIGVRFDAVLAFFFFDMFDKETLVHVVKGIKNSMHREAVWLVSDFVTAKWWHNSMLFLMYFFFKVIGALDTEKLPSWRSILQQQQVHLKYTSSYFGGFIRSCVYTMESREV